MAATADYLVVPGGLRGNVSGLPAVQSHAHR